MTTTRTLNALPTVVNWSPSASVSAAAFVLPSKQFNAAAHVTLNICNSPEGYNQSQTTLVTASTNASIYYPSSETWGGFANLSVPAVSDGSDLTILVSPPSASTSTLWSFELGVSLQATAWHTLDKFALYAYEDSDNTSALLTSPTYPSALLSSPPAYQALIAQTSQVRLGLANSTCYIRSLSSLIPSNQINTSTTTRGVVELTEAEGGYVNETLRGGQRMQYSVDGLQPGTNYTVWGLQNTPSMSTGNSTASRLFLPQFFATKSASNCRLVYDLPFCPDVAYSVPAPPTMDTSLLLSLYDNATSASLQAFNQTLSLFSCDEPIRSTQGMYSRVRTCSQCMAAYTSWLCAVSMPRCTDSDATQKQNASRNIGSNPTQFLRKTANNSRTPFLPSSAFPYAEVPPCIDVCSMVRASCPPIISTPFNCPLAGITLEESYATPFRQQIAFSNVAGGDDTAWLGHDLNHHDFVTRARDRFGNVACNDLGTINLVTRRRWSGSSSPTSGAFRRSASKMSFVALLLAGTVTAVVL
ncbi:stretch-activated cation channel mid1 [Cystobasidiomycetes sp. EMM_F5]